MAGKKITNRCSDWLELSFENIEPVRVTFALNICDKETKSWVATTKGIDAGLVSEFIMRADENRFGADSAHNSQFSGLVTKAVAKR